MSRTVLARSIVERTEATVHRRLSTVDERRDVRRLRSTTTELTPARPGVPFASVGPGHAARVDPRRGRSELVLSEAARPLAPTTRSVTPVSTVYRRATAPPTAPSFVPPPPAVSAPSPAIDIDHLDRELWRRFEKRARTERERHGRA